MSQNPTNFAIPRPENIQGLDAVLAKKYLKQVDKLNEKGQFVKREYQISHPFTRSAKTDRVARTGCLLNQQSSIFATKNK